MQPLLQAIASIEAAHFRTIDDTGANSCAMLILNSLRRQAGLPYLSKDDLPSFDATLRRYVLPVGSKLLANAHPTTVYLSTYSHGYNGIRHSVISETMDDHFALSRAGGVWIHSVTPIFI